MHEALAEDDVEPRLSALERCFEKVPSPEVSTATEEAFQQSYLVGRLTAIELKVFGFDQTGVPHDLMGRLTAMELKALGFVQSGYRSGHNKVNKPCWETPKS